MSASKERTAICTEAGTLYMWEDKGKRKGRRDAGDGGRRAEAGGRPPDVELVAVARHVAGIAVGEKHSLCLQTLYCPKPVEAARPRRRVPSLHSLAQRAVGRIAEPRVALPLIDCADALQAGELKALSQRMALGNLDLLLAAAPGCLAVLDAELLAELEGRLKRCQISVATSAARAAPFNELEFAAEAGGAEPPALLFHRPSACGGTAAGAGEEGAASSGKLSRRTSLGDDAGPSETVEASFADGGRAAAAASAAAKVVRGLKKKLQQVAALELRLAERGPGALDAQQLLKLRRKPVLLDALAQLEAGALAADEAQALIAVEPQPGASSSTATAAAPPPPPARGDAEAFAEAPPEAAPAAPSSSSKKKAKKRRSGRAKGEAADPPGQAAAAEAAAALPPAKARWSDLDEQGRTAPSPPQPLPPKGRPPAPPKAVAPRAAAEGVDLSAFNYSVSPLASRAAYPDLHAAAPPPPQTTRGFSPPAAAAGGGSGAAAGPKGKPKVRAKGGLSAFLSGDLDRKRTPPPGPPAASSSGRGWVGSAGGGGVSLADIQKEQQAAGASPATPPPAAFQPRAGSSASSGRPSLGDFLTANQRPAAWGGSPATASPPSGHRGLAEIQADEERKARLKHQVFALGQSPPAFGSSPLGASPSKWYRQDKDVLPVTDFRALQARESAAAVEREQEAAAREAAAREAAAPPGQGVAGGGGDGRKKRPKKPKKAKGKAPEAGGPVNQIPPAALETKKKKTRRQKKKPAPAPAPAPVPSH